MSQGPDRPLSDDELLPRLAWIRALARGLVADPNVADDVLQQVCVLALQKPLHRERGEAGLRAWLATLTRRLASHAQRGERRSKRREQRAARPEALPPTVDVAAHRELLRELVDALTSLEEPAYSLIVMRYQEGLSTAEIAARLDLSEAAVRQRLSRARRRLRAHLEQRLDGQARRLRALLVPLSAAWRGPAPTPAVPPSSSFLGAHLMAKLGLTLTQIAVGTGLASAVLVTAWYGLAAARTTPTPEPVPIASRADDDRAPELLSAAPPAPAPLVADVASVATPEAAPSAAPPTPQAAPPPLSGEVLEQWLDEATLSFLGPDPDLVALQDVVRALGRAARIVPGSVATHPPDGSTRGWVEVEGTELRGEFTISTDDDFRVQFDTMSPAQGDQAASGAGYFMRGFGLSFGADGAAIDQAGAYVQFHPDTSSKALPQLLATLAQEGPAHVGWHVSIGPDGTAGKPIAMAPSEMEGGMEGGLVIGKSLGLPDLDAPWASDTTAYLPWLDLLGSAAP